MAFVPHTDHGFQPAWSPDGGWLVFSRDDGGDAELWKIRADGSDLTQLTSNAAEDWEPSWSPGGTRIAFTREGAGGTTSIMTLASGGGGELAVTPAGGFDQAPDWSPDGKRIAFNRFLPGDGNRVFTVAPSGKALTQVTFGGGPKAFNDVHPAWSPDGTQDAFARAATRHGLPSTSTPSPVQRQDHPSDQRPGPGPDAVRSRSEAAPSGGKLEPGEGYCAAACMSRSPGPPGGPAGNIP